MKIAFYGLRRSGNHAVIEWLLRNISGVDEVLRIAPKFCVSGKSCYLNSLSEGANSIPGRAKRNADIKFAELNFNNIIYTFEDVSPTNYNTPYNLGEINFKIAIIRDLKCLFASRMRKTELMGDDFRMMPINQRIANHWIQFCNLANDPSWILIKFEDWVGSISYKEQICAHLGIENLFDSPNISIDGGGSSFTGLTRTPTLNDLQCRWKEVVFPDNINQILESDKVINAYKVYQNLN